MSNKDIFIGTYRQCLIFTIKEHPEQYAYPVSEADFVVARMAAAIERGSFNKDGYAFKATCKILGVPYTYKGIKSYWNTPEEVS